MHFKKGDVVLVDSIAYSSKSGSQFLAKVQKIDASNNYVVEVIDNMGLPSTKPGRQVIAAPIRLHPAGDETFLQALYEGDETEG